MVLKQSNSLQEGPRCNPFAANGRGWSKGGCTHDSEENHRALLPSCVPAPCLPWAGFQAQGLLAHPWGHPRSPHGSHHAPWPGTQPCPPRPAMRLRLLRTRPKTRAAAGQPGASRLSPWGWPCGMCCFLVQRQAHVARSTLAQQALSLPMVAGVGFGMLHLKVRGQKGQEEQSD